MEKEDIIEMVIIDESNTLYPYEYSQKDLNVLNYQDKIIGYKETFDKYKSYTEIIVYGCRKIKAVSDFAKKIVLQN